MWLCDGFNTEIVIMMYLKWKHVCMMEGGAKISWEVLCGMLDGLGLDAWTVGKRWLEGR